MNSTLTIATWNLRLPSATPNVRNEALLREILAVNADIWVLTETNDSIKVPGYYSLATPVTSRRNEGVRTTMIWSRWPIHEVPVFPSLTEQEEPTRTWPSYTVSSRDTSPAVCAEVLVPHCPLLVYGTVITYFGDRGPWGTSLYNQEQRKAVCEHGHDWRRLRDASPDQPFIVAGDFDATCDERNSPTIATCRMLRSALEWSELTCLSKDHWIDHICVSKEHYVSSEVCAFHPKYDSPWANARVRLSDHHGIVAKVTLGR